VNKITGDQARNEPVGR